MTGKQLRLLGITALACFVLPTVTSAQQFGIPFGVSMGGSCGPSCGTACQTHHCPPAYKHCYEGAPHIHFRRGCPHPICNPCDLPHFGYFDTCWSPYPFPPSWGHCLTPPPAAFVNLDPYYNPNMPKQRPPVVLPQPGTTVPTPRPMSTVPMPMPNGPIEELQAPRRLNGQP